jgi:hypothetical protein
MNAPSSEAYKLRVQKLMRSGRWYGAQVLGMAQLETLPRRV